MFVYSTVIGMFTGHTKSITTLVKLNKNNFSTSSNDSLILIWDFQNENYINKLAGHTSMVSSLIKIDEYRIISGSFDLSLKLWDYQKGNCLYTLLFSFKNPLYCLFLTNYNEITEGNSGQKFQLNLTTNKIINIGQITGGIQCYLKWNSMSHLTD